MLLLQRKSPSRNSEKKKFQILYITTEKVKITKPSIQKPVLDLRQKVIIFHLINYVSPLIQKLHGKMKQKLALLLLCYMTVSCMTLTLTLLWWMVVVKGRCQFSSSWCFLSMVTPWFVSNVEYLNIEVLKTYFSRFLTTSAEQLFHRALFDDILGRKQCAPFRKMLALSEKPV